MPAMWLWNTLSTVSTFVVLICSALWTYYYWVKRRLQEHSLNRMAQGFRWGGIAFGVVLYFLERKSGSHSLWFPYVVVLTCVSVLVLLFIPDAS